MASGRSPYERIKGGAVKIVIAPNAFKGSLSARDAACALEEGIKKGLESADTLKIPMADGGDGTVDALVMAAGGKLVSKEVSGPLGRPVQATYGMLGDGETAVIEMALASGLALVPADERNPLLATTFGTGELIKEALDKGCRRIIIGIGGSATNDGGAGMAQALGVRLLDGSGSEIMRGGAALRGLRRIDASGLDRRVADAQIIAASDVTNPLCGPEGASYVYGPQKGASAEMAGELDKALLNFSRIVEKDLGVRVKDIPGAGAAGGLGAGLIAFLGAEMRSGVGLVMDIAGFEKAVEGAFLVITGEGKIDAQTGYGKAPGVVAEFCRGKNIPVIGVCGVLDDEIDELYARGFAAFLPITKAPCTPDYAMENAYRLLADAGRNLSGLIRVLTEFPETGDSG